MKKIVVLCFVAVAVVALALIARRKVEYIEVEEILFI